MNNQLTYKEYGSKKGNKVIYFHGTPGSMEECSILHEHARLHNLHILCFDRFSIDTSYEGDRYYEYLAKCIDIETNGSEIDLIGFSIGCYVAIKVHAFLGNKVSNLHLVSAAAPLNVGSFTDNMAGHLVFTLAAKYPLIFSLLSHWQRLIAIVSPKTLFSLLFASARSADQLLVTNKEFKRYLIPILQHCFKVNIQGYMREIEAYVLPWDSHIIACEANSYIWHGKDDNWSPVGMAHYLAGALPNVVSVEILKGLSHYSCLLETVPTICERLGQYHRK